MAYRSSTARTGSSTSTPAYAVPAGAAADDIAIVAMYAQAAGAITPPTGFTQKYDSGVVNTHRLVIFWKRLTGADSGSYTFTMSASDWVEGTCSLYSGRVTSGDPFTATSSVTTDAVQSVVAPAITAATGDDLVGCAQSFNGGGTWTPAASMTERIDRQVDAGITLNTQDNVSSGSTGTKTFTTTAAASGMKAFLGALAVASGGSTPIAGADTGTAADTSTVAPTITGTDTGTGADTGTTTASLTSADTAIGTDAANPIGISSTVTDIGTGIDAGTLTVNDTASDTATGVDTSSATVSITAGDTATGVDTATVDTGATAKSGTDTAVGVEAATFTATENAAETATGIDTGTIVVGAMVADVAVMTDSATVTVIQPIYRFSPPTHEEPIRMAPPYIGALNRYRLTYAKTVLRRNGTFISVRSPDPSWVVGVAGVDYFIGGYEYIITPATKAELEAAGYTVTS